MLEFKTFSAKVNDAVVGAFTFEYIIEDSYTSLTDQYDIEYFLDLKLKPINNSYALLRYMIINPLFENSVRYMLRQVMRQLGVNCNLYMRYLDHLDDE